MSISQPLSSEDYPFVQEFVMDSTGQIQKEVGWVKRSGTQRQG